MLGNSVKRSITIDLVTRLLTHPETRGAIPCNREPTTNDTLPTRVKRVAWPWGAKMELCEYANTQGKPEIGPFAAARTQ
jgi:hypothetical protein